MAARYSRQVRTAQQARDRSIHQNLSSFGAKDREAEDPEVKEMRLNRRANSKNAMRTTAGSGVGGTFGGGSVTFATGRPVDPMFYWKQNNWPFDIYDPVQLRKLRALCRIIAMTHPVMASCIEIYAKYPMSGMELTCFAGDTEVITRNGTKPIRDLAGSTHSLLTSGGHWTDAPVRGFGHQPLTALTVRRNGRQKVIHTTAEHRWFVERTQGPGKANPGEQNLQAKLTWEQVETIRSEYAAGGVTQQALGKRFGITQPMVGQIVRGAAWQASGRMQTVPERGPYTDEVTTAALEPGDRLTGAWARSLIRETNPSPFGIAHGVTWGDGALATSGGGAVVDLFGAKDAALLRFFQGCTTYDFGLRDGANVASIRVTNLPAFFKRLPDINESTSYLYGFLAGWFAADGTVSRDGGEAYLDSVDAEAVRFARNVCQRLGIKTYAPYVIQSVKELPNGTSISDHVAYRLPLDVDSLTEAFFATTEHHRRWMRRPERSRHERWTVVSVEETDRVEEVFCAVVPKTASFALEDNILTGNCKDPALTEFYNTLFLDQLNWEEYSVEVGKEYWTVGEAWPLGSFSETLGVWEDDELINPDDIEVERSPFLKEPRFKMRLPQSIREVLERREPAWEYEALVRNYPELLKYRGDEARMPVSNVLLKQLAFRADSFHPRGIPIMLRAMRALMQEEMLNAAQDAVASRLYTPLILAKLGASATDLGTKAPWIPTEEDKEAFEDTLDAALAADFRVLVHHFACNMEQVFGRESMPVLDSDFDRLTEKQLQAFGLSKTALSGAADGETYAADALNRDYATQLLTGYQRMQVRLYKDRAKVVAEAQEHWDYEERGGKRYPIMEEVLEKDEETGEQRIVEQPKLLIPDMKIKAMNMRDEDSNQQFMEALRAAGVPISMKTRLVNVPIDLDEETGHTADEQVAQAVKAQEVRRDTFNALRDQGLPIPQDLLTDFQPIASVPPQPAAPDQVVPTLGTGDPANTSALAPTDADMQAEQAGVDPTQMQPGDPTGAADMPVQQAAANVIPLPRNMARPPESDEQRQGMPRAGLRVVAGALIETQKAVMEGGEFVFNDDGSPKMATVTLPDDMLDDDGNRRRSYRLEDGPLHIGWRRHAGVKKDEPLPDRAS